MFKDIKAFIKNYNTQWFVADFMFVSDMLANSIWGQKYYEIFSYWGMSPGMINSIISILELIRILMLLYQKHQSDK